MNINFKRIALAVLIISFFYNNIDYPKTLVTKEVFAAKFKMQWIQPTYSEHTIAYGIDSKKAEAMYLYIRHGLGLDEKVNDKVYIYNVAPKESFDSITKFKIHGQQEYILGVYSNHVIAYNGNDEVLAHELAHFFFEKANWDDRSEMFAQAVELIYKLVNTMKLQVTAIEL